MVRAGVPDLRHSGHATRHGTAARPAGCCVTGHPGGRRGTTWCGSGSSSPCEPRRQGEYRNSRSARWFGRQYALAPLRRNGWSVHRGGSASR